jgi:hypothetical protein
MVFVSMEAQPDVHDRADDNHDVNVDVVQLVSVIIVETVNVIANGYHVKDSCNDPINV